MPLSDPSSNFWEPLSILVQRCNLLRKAAIAASNAADKSSYNQSKNRLRASFVSVNLLQGKELRRLTNVCEHGADDSPHFLHAPHVAVEALKLCLSNC